MNRDVVLNIPGLPGPFSIPKTYGIPYWDVNNGNGMVRH
jgi:hypothetical protein